MAATVEILSVKYKDQVFSIDEEVIHVDGDYSTIIKEFILHAYPDKIWFYNEDRNTKDLINFRKLKPTDKNYFKPRNQDPA